MMADSNDVKFALVFSEAKLARTRSTSLEIAYICTSLARCEPIAAMGPEVDRLRPRAPKIMGLPGRIVIDL